MTTRECKSCGAGWEPIAESCHEVYFCYHCGEELDHEIPDEQPFEYFTTGDILKEGLKKELDKTDWDAEARKLKKEK